MGNCKDCRFWGHYRQISETRRACDCDSTDFHGNIPDNGFSVEVSVSDDTGLDYDLITGPLFGCVRFQPIVIDQEPS